MGIVLSIILVIKTRIQLGMTNITEQIKQIDEKLSLLRESWQDANPNKKARWMKMINEALDERLVLMEKRDKMG